MAVEIIFFLNIMMPFSYLIIIDVLQDFKNYSKHNCKLFVSIYGQLIIIVCVCFKRFTKTTTSFKYVPPN
ncbi:hypothetical protein D172_007440 [Pseudoalteromonas sp. Bsw20308]|nr:hypothetical protein D172_007440 [Pseudoalteromonas sp. Bsw20308]